MNVGSFARSDKTVQQTINFTTLLAQAGGGGAIIDNSIRVIMMPRDTNQNGTIFGGVILSYLDQAGAIEARRQGLGVLVTVSMDKVVFHEPVFVGDLVSFWTETLRIGTTSITTKVVVEAIRDGHRSEKVLVTEAQVVYVNLGADRRPAPIQRS